MTIENLILRMNVLENLKEYLQSFLNLNPENELYISMLNKIESECEKIDSQLKELK